MKWPLRPTVTLIFVLVACFLLQNTLARPARGHNQRTRGREGDLCATGSVGSETGAFTIHVQRANILSQVDERLAAIGLRRSPTPFGKDRLTFAVWRQNDKVLLRGNPSHGWNSRSTATSGSFHSQQEPGAANARPKLEPLAHEEVQRWCAQNEWLHASLSQMKGIDLVERHKVVDVHPRVLVPTDPEIDHQWHLSLMNVSGAWNLDLSGSGVSVVVIDDGIHRTNGDLSGNFDAEISWDVSDGDDDPTPLASLTHGTSCGGIIGATDSNGVCGTGIAPNVALGGIRFLEVSSSSLDEATALTLNLNDLAKQQVDIFSNSWGPLDDGCYYFSLSDLSEAAFERGVSEGRGGKGFAYVWAAGNGRVNDDNCNYDMLANSRFTIAVGGVDSSGVVAYYSEPCAAMLVTAPGGDSSDYVYTTETPTGCPDPNDSSFAGTSASCPMVSGAIALALEHNPNLTWRDLQHLLVRTSARTDPTDSDWAQNGAGIWFNHNYGAGLVDVGALVHLASNWVSVGEEISLKQTNKSTNVNVTASSTTTLEMHIDAQVRIETVRISLSIDIGQGSTTAWGLLGVKLVSPGGFPSVLAENRHLSSSLNCYTTRKLEWTYMSVRHWDEKAQGLWTLEIENNYPVSLLVESFSLEFHGTEPGECTTTFDCEVIGKCNQDKVSLNCASCPQGKFGSTCNGTCANTEWSHCVESAITCGADGIPTSCSECQDEYYGDLCASSCEHHCLDENVVCSNGSAVSCSLCERGWFGADCSTDLYTSCEAAAPDGDYSWLGDGFCDGNFNKEGCAYDAGDCCQSTCDCTTNPLTSEYGECYEHCDCSASCINSDPFFQDWVHCIDPCETHTCVLDEEIYSPDCATSSCVENGTLACHVVFADPGTPCSNGGGFCNNNGTCVDECPSDPSKGAPSECGCGVADIDTDGDGVMDCVDSCPLHADHVCFNGGACNEDGICDCPEAYIDAYCLVESCTPSCVNGTCTHLGCICDEGYSGDACDIFTCVPECTAQGTCIGPNTCDCEAGYEGDLCGDPVCSSGCGFGTCVSPEECECNSGYNGTRCDNPICTSPCVNGNCTAPDTCLCEENWFGVSCNVCTDGWSGASCSQAICYPVCENGGNCTAPNACDCEEGYDGDHCHIPICDTVDCLNGGTCSAPNTCACPIGYESVDCSPVCVQPCTNGGNCTAPNDCSCPGNHGGVDCSICLDGWSGPNCTTFVCDPNCEHGLCVGPNTCECEDGYSGASCSIPVCSPSCKHGTCVSPGQCSCSSGWSGSSCNSAICSNGCSGNGVCLSPEQCSCFSHFSGSRCHVCEEGWSGDECNVALCSNDCIFGSCTHPDVCTCLDGYNGTECGNPICDPPCVSGQGTCVNPNDCRCEQGFSGSTCDAPICENDCYSGTCVSPGNCVCPEKLTGDCSQCIAGWVGTNCSEAVCASPCGSHGTCTNPDVCTCEDGYEGDSCEVALSDKSSDGSGNSALIAGSAIAGLFFLGGIIMAIVYVFRRPSSSPGRGGEDVPIGVLPTINASPSTSRKSLVHVRSSSHYSVSLSSQPGLDSDSEHAGPLSRNPLYSVSEARSRDVASEYDDVFLGAPVEEEGVTQ